MTTRRATNVDGAKNFIRDTQPACRWTRLAIQLSFSSWTYRVFIGSLPGATFRALMARASVTPSVPLDPARDSVDCSFMDLPRVHWVFDRS